MTTELPPLPATDLYLCFYDEGGMQDAPGQGYTADQMRAYAAEAVRLARQQALEEAQILGFAMHAADRIPASNYEGRVLHAVRMAERALGIKKDRT